MLVPEQLIVLLVIVVSLSVIVVHVTLLVPVFATGVIGTSEAALLVLRRVVPGVIGLLHTVPGDELHHGLVTEVATLYEIRVQFGESPVQIALRADVRQSALDAPVPVQQSRTETQGLLMRIVGAATQVQSEVGLQTDILRLHTQRGTKGTSTVGRCTHTTLYLHRLHTGGEVTHVHPVELGTLRIIDGDTIRRDIDTTGISTTHPQRGIADTITSIRCHRH